MSEPCGRCHRCTPPTTDAEGCPDCAGVPAPRDELPCATCTYAPPTTDAGRRDRLAALIYAEGQDAVHWWMPTVDGSPNAASYAIADAILRGAASGAPD